MPDEGLSLLVELWNRVRPEDAEARNDPDLAALMAMNLTSALSCGYCMDSYDRLRSLSDKLDRLGQWPAPPQPITLDILCAATKAAATSGVFQRLRRHSPGKATSVGISPAPPAPEAITPVATEGGLDLGGSIGRHYLADALALEAWLHDVFLPQIQGVRDRLTDLKRKVWAGTAENDDWAVVIHWMMGIHNYIQSWVDVDHMVDLLPSRPSPAPAAAE